MCDHTITTRLDKMLCYYIIGPIVLFIKMLKLFFNIKYTQYLQVLVATSTFVADVEDVTSACVVCVPLMWYKCDVCLCGLCPSNVVQYKPKNGILEESESAL